MTDIPTRGISALLAAAGPYSEHLEQEMEQLVSERNRQKKPPPMPGPRPLSEEAIPLVSKGITMPAEQIANEANAAVAKYVEDALALQAEVKQWGEGQIANAQKTANVIAERHAALLRSRPLFIAAMNGEEPKPTE